MECDPNHGHFTQTNPIEILTQQELVCFSLMLISALLLAIAAGITIVRECFFLPK
jgi:hypothetical protein